jgi:hypothetical protein
MYYVAYYINNKIPRYHIYFISRQMKSQSLNTHMWWTIRPIEIRKIVFWCNET